MRNARLIRIHNVVTKIRLILNFLCYNVIVKDK